MAEIIRSLAENEKDSAYEYLCRLDEAKRWIEELIGELFPPLQEFEDSLANGVYLCKLGMKLLPDSQYWKKVYDLDQSKYLSKGLDFRHTDNLNFFVNCLPKLGLSKVFHPCVNDIYRRKNLFKLVYCLHALSHLMCKQGKTKVAVNGYNVAPTIDDEVLKKATLTLRESNVTSFDTVESLVEEEMQYAQIGITEHETTEDDESSSQTAGTVNGGVTHEREGEERKEGEGSNGTGIFDDPKYVRVSGFGDILPNQEEVEGEVPTYIPRVVSFEMHSILADLKCQGAGISVGLYTGFNDTSNSDKEFTDALQQINKCVGGGDPRETLKALQNPNANLPFPYLEATDYYSALVFEKSNGLPSNTTAVYKGLKRSLCDNLLEKMRPGAYLLRQSTTLGNGEFVFSFRNQVGIKHWKLSINNEGKLSWKGTRGLFESLESFLKYFVEALQKVTKLFVYPGTAFMLKLNTLLLKADQLEILEELRKSSNKLSYGQVAYIISDINSRIRKARANSSKEVQPLVVSRRSRTAPNMMSLDLMDDDTQPWDMSMIMRVTRKEADGILENKGFPGSFLVRPSENSTNNYALAFRTRKDTRRWRIVQTGGKFYVHPRPNPYNTLSDIIKHFRDAVGAETGLVMTPLVADLTEVKRNVETRSSFKATLESPGTPEHPFYNRFPPYDGSTHHHGDLDSLPPVPTRRGRHLHPGNIDVVSKPSASMSRLNPANITSWSVDDVCQWLLSSGLGKFVDVFRDNIVDGECLLTLDNNLLKDDLKISQLGYRSKIMKRVDTLKMSQYTEQLKS